MSGWSILYGKSQHVTFGLDKITNQANSDFICENNGEKICHGATKVSVGGRKSLGWEGDRH